MPKEEYEKLGEFYRVRWVPTLWDKIKEALGAIAGMAFVIFIIVSIVTS